jgi:hypothetical protein
MEEISTETEGREPGNDITDDFLTLRGEIFEPLSNFDLGAFDPLSELDAWGFERLKHLLDIMDENIENYLDGAEARRFLFLRHEMTFIVHGMLRAVNVIVRQDGKTIKRLETEINELQSRLAA